jgi:hypothetical protein
MLGFQDYMFFNKLKSYLLRYDSHKGSFLHYLAAKDLQ